MLRPWIRLEEDSKDDNNPDMEDYIGRGDLTAFISGSKMTSH